MKKKIIYLFIYLLFLLNTSICGRTVKEETRLSCFNNCLYFSARTDKIPI